MSFEEPQERFQKISSFLCLILSTNDNLFSLLLYYFLKNFCSLHPNAHKPIILIPMRKYAIYANVYVGYLVNVCLSVCLSVLLSLSLSLLHAQVHLSVQACLFSVALQWLHSLYFMHVIYVAYDIVYVRPYMYTLDVSSTINEHLLTVRHQ